MAYHWGMAKDLTAIRIDGDLVEALKRISDQPGGFYSERTVNWLICRAVKEFVERHAPSAQPKPTKSKQ